MSKICVIGSLQYTDEMDSIANKLECYRPQPNGNIQEERLKCYKAIVKCDVVLVYGEHIGEDVKYEIDLAKRMGKCVAKIM